MRAATARAEHSASAEQRKYERTRTTLTGKMFVPAEERTVECGVVDISAGGAGVTCAEMPPLETYVVLYVDDYGRFESVVTRVVGDVLGLRFVCNDAKRTRLIEKLTSPMQPAMGDGAPLRRSKRLKASPISSFMRGTGERVTCEVIDISLSGASLKTETQPAIGEMILIGHMAARIIRHHEHGIAIVFATTPES